MIFSNEEILRQKNLLNIERHESDITSSLRFEKHMPIRITLTEDELKDKLKDCLYFDEHFKEKFGIEKTAFYKAVIASCIYTIGEDLNNRKIISEGFEKVLEMEGMPVFDGIDKLIDDNEIICNPMTAYINLKRKLILAHKDKAPISTSSKELMRTTFKDIVDYCTKKKDFLLFEKFINDKLDKTSTIYEKLKYVASYIYYQNTIMYGTLECKAADYYMTNSNYADVYLNNVSELEIQRAERETSKWLKNHKKPETFIELRNYSAAKDSLSLICKLLDIIGFNYYHYRYDENFDKLEEEQLQKIIATLDKYPYIYKNDKDIRNLLIYFCYAVLPIIQHGKSYVGSYLANAINVDKLEYKCKKLEKEINPLKQHYQEKQEALNRLQLEYERMTNKELELLRLELEEKNKLLQEQSVKLGYLEEINSVLEGQLNELNNNDKSGSLDELTIQPSPHLESILKELNIIIMGGHRIWQNKVREVYPYFNFIDADNINYDINLTRNADYIFFNTLHCSHTLFYKVKNNMSNGKNEHKANLVYVGTNNLGHLKDIISRTVLEQLK